MILWKISWWWEKRTRRQKLWLQVPTLLLFVVWWAYIGITLSRNPAAGLQLYKQIGLDKPFSPLDFYGGLMIGFMLAVMLAILIGLLETRRFEKQIKGPTGSGGGGGRVRLPMSRKVVAIDQFRKLDPEKEKWRMQDRPAATA